MPNPVFSSLPTSIFQHITGLALKHDAINLGQGFPDQDGPISLREAASRALIDGPNQYPPSKGLLALRQAVHVLRNRVVGELGCDVFGAHAFAALPPALAAVG